MIALPPTVAFALDTLEQAGFAAYAVGGGVRDCLRQLVPDDWDVATAALPAQVAQVFAAYDVRPTGLKHGTMTVTLTDTATGKRVPIEITTYRTEQGYADGRHPDVVHFVQDITADLARRDFTINAIAYSPTRGLCDPYGGTVDLTNGVLRCVGDATVRFGEDALRILRGLRFAATTGFTLDVHTVRGMRATMYGMRNLAPERVRVELCKLLEGQHVGTVLRQYNDILAVVLPEIAPMFGMAQHTRFHLYDIWEHTVQSVEACVPDWRLRMVMLLHDVGKPATFTIDAQGRGHFYGHPTQSAQLATEIFARLRLSNQDAVRLVLLIALHDEMPARTPVKIRRALAAHGAQALRDLLEIARCDTLARGKNLDYLDELQERGRQLEAEIAQNPCLSIPDLAIDGNDLQQLGLQGKEIGQTLHTLLDWVIEHPAYNTKLHLLCYLWKTGHAGENPQQMTP